MSQDILLTVSGSIPDDIQAQVEQGQRPETDYMALARALPADLLDYPSARKAGGWIGRLLEKLGGKNLMLAWACFRLRRQYRVIFTDGEQVGIPLALMLKLFGGQQKQRHLMIVHILSVGKKMAFFDILGIQSHIDTFLTYSTWQKQFIETRWAIPSERVVFTPFMVNTDFFAPEQAREPNAYRDAGDRPMICAVGLEYRDYPTLLEAVRGLDVHVIIAAASPWSKRPDTTADQAVPDNVTVRRFSQYELRQVYAASRFLVMPLYNVTFQAGVTALLEAMAMEKAVICSQTPGQTDVVVEGETGLYVPPGDVPALRAAICRLIDQPEEAERMGRSGRKRVMESMSLDCYTRRLSRLVQESITR